MSASRSEGARYCQTTLCQTTVSTPGTGSASSRARNAEAGSSSTRAGTRAATSSAPRSRSSRATWSAQTYDVSVRRPSVVVGSTGYGSQPARSTTRTATSGGLGPRQGSTSRTGDAGVAQHSPADLQREGVDAAG